MKIYLTINGLPLNTYTTVDPFGGQGKTAVDHRNLDTVCSTNECTELYAPDILNHIHISELEIVIKHYISKLRHGGKLIIGGTDIRDIAKKIIKDDISLQDANVALYGSGPLNWLNKTGGYAMHNIVDLLKANGLKVNKMKSNDLKFIIEAQRE